MFEGLSDRLSGILSGLTRRGALTEADVTAAMREVRRALLEADVALEVVRGFTDRVREKAVGATVLKSVTPGQMVVKLVNDELVAMLGTDAETISLNAPAPVPVLMVGLQGSGKTTTTAKIARRLTERERRKVLLASLDTPGLCLDGYPAVMAVLAQRCCLGQVLLLLVVAHVDHDRVEWQLVSHEPDLLPVLRMVQVYRDGHCCCSSSHGCCVDQGWGLA